MSLHRRAVASAVACLALSGCGLKADMLGSPQATIGPAAPLPTATTHTASGNSTGTAAPAALVVTGHGWTRAGGIAHLPVGMHCRIRYASDGEPLPDPACTPGAIDNAVTQANLSTTLCRPGGYTRSVRPPEAVTEAAKRVVFAAYGLPWRDASKYELDHLVPLGAGGSSDARNLWPEPDTFQLVKPGGSDQANDKDAVEDKLRDAICARRTRLRAGQDRIASNWTKLPPVG